MKRVGLIGLDTSHVVAFSRLLNDSSDPHHLAGARVTCGWPGGSFDFDLSISRVEQFTSTVRDDYGVEILPTPEDVAGQVDVVFITAVDGRVHRTLLERVLPAGKPVFIDKPLATTLSDAQSMVDQAAKHGVPLMSASSLRFADNLTSVLSGIDRRDIHGADIYGPMNLQATQPGLFWYGIHMVEVAVAVMGPDWDEVRAVATEGHDLVTITWGDGRIASLHGLRGSHGTFGVVLHTAAGPLHVDLSHNARPYYASLLAAILHSLPEGRPAAPVEETLAVMAIIEAANLSRGNGGAIPVQR